MKSILKFIPVLLLVAVVLASGCVSGPSQNAQNQVLEDGTIVKSDGTMIKPDGTMVMPDGTMVKPDGTMIKPDGTMIKPDGTMIEPDGTMIEPDGTVVEPAQGQGQLSGSTTAPDSYESYQRIAKNYYRYDPAAFEQARSEGKAVFMDFHANWCPICNGEKPSIVAGFNDANYDDVIGFEVHYNDAETKSFDNDLVKQYQVAYQHTKVVLNKDGEVVLKTLEVFDKNKVLEVLASARNA